MGGNLLINTYPLANPKGIFYIEGIIFIGKECPTVLTKLGGTYSERFSGVDTICLQLLDWLCSSPPYADFFCNTTKYSIFPDRGITADMEAENDFEDSMFPKAPEPTDLYGPEYF